jgi:chaperone modulatory protein CbpM
LLEACEEAGVEKTFVVRCLRAHWVTPAFPEEAELDEVDLARLRMIATLREDFGVNEEAVPVILHLLDQMHGA